jgi:copper-containing nitrite reductase
MIRVKQGDTVEVTLQNDAHSTMVHSVDFHAALGPGGGAELSQVLPGESKIFTFVATTPGLFVYHCGTPMVAQHISNGMYGLILVEPAGGLPHVDHEFYVMQGELYTTATKGTTGLQQFSNARLMDETPEYFVFNGAVDALVKAHPLQAKVGESVRVFFGDAGPNATSSLHVVGEIFTRAYALGSLTSPPLTGVQTVGVPPGSATIVELIASVPGRFTMMDHAMARVAKGLMAMLEVTGPQNASLMHAGPASPGPGQNVSTQISGMTQADLTEAMVNSEAGPIQLASARPRSSATNNAESHADAMAAMPMHHGGATSATTVRQPGVVRDDIPVSKSGPTAPAGVNGCLTLQDDGKAMLKVLGSSKVYRLEAQPFLFSENANRLVHVTGQFGSAVAEEDPNVPSFVVDTVEKLAPNCSTSISASAIRKTLAKPTADRAIVRMNDIGFSPATLTISAGQKVTWQNSSGVVHNVVDDASKALYRVDVKLPPGGKQFDSGWLRTGESFSRVFTVPGVYRYVCTLHESQGMKGVVIVRTAPMLALDK